VEASKISSGNITLENTKLDMCEMISQALGEFEDRLEERNLTVICDKPENSLFVWADSVRLWRVLENLLGNICKYSMPASRVYIDLSGPEEKTEGTGGAEQGMIRLTMKNISEKELNITPRELTERFVRGDESRNTEGSGLGLSIAKDLVELMKGTFTIDLDGDLFKITILLPESK
jgi:signal transduction histidine kinase